MRWRLVVSCLLFPSLGLAGCGTEWAVPRETTRSSALVSFEPFGGAEAVPAVVRVRVAGAASRAKLEEFRIFEGELSEYHLGRIAARELPKTLVERSVPAVVWSEGDAVVVAPVVPLASGRYALAAPGLGLLSDFQVDDGVVPWLTRRWPPAGVTSGNGVQLFCGDSAPSVASGAVLLAPAQRAAELTPGFAPSAAFESECVTLTPTEPLPEGTLLLPPPLAGGAALEPRPLFASEAAAESFVCLETERPLGPVCASVEDDRVRLRSPEAPSLWVTEQPEARWFVIAAGASAVVRGFRSGEARRFQALAFDASGASFEIEESITGSAARDHVVINEVLANPNGAEASGEWVELFNDGGRPVELSDFELVDAGGAVALPSHQLGAGEFALLVGPRFEPDPELDVLPAAGTKVLRLPSLGNAGLSNSGELLRLRHRSGREVSRMPAIRAAKSGFSVARRTPDAGDTASDFAVHAEPGASPGAPNQLAENTAP